MTAARCVLECGNRLGEGPIWSIEEQALYWVDILAPAVHRFIPSSKSHDRWLMPSHVGCLALRRQGGLMLALKDGFATFDPASGEVRMTTPVEADLPGNRFNDGRCDRQGRFVAGSMSYETKKGAGSLWRLDDHGAATRILADITISNGLCWSPAGDIMYHADTPSREIMAYAYDQPAGIAHEPRLFVRLPDAGGSPDGSITDSEGCLWNAEWDGGRVVRYRPDGRFDQSIALPVPRVTCCAFGGPDLKTLYITTAWDGMSDAARTAAPMAGHLFAVDVEVAGLPEPAFAA